MAQATMTQKGVAEWDVERSGQCGATDDLQHEHRGQEQRGGGAGGRVGKAARQESGARAG
jgi:hypothetical protein